MILKEELLFLPRKLSFMDIKHNAHDNIIDNEADIELSKPTKSRFLFLLFFFGFFIFAWAGCYQLHEHKFVNTEDIEVPENTTYSPKYK